MNPLFGRWIVYAHVVDRILSVARPRQVLLLIKAALAVACDAILRSPRYLGAVAQCLRERGEFRSCEWLTGALTDSYLDRHSDQTRLRLRTCPRRQKQNKVNQYAFHGLLPKLRRNSRWVIMTTLLPVGRYVSALGFSSIG